MSSALPLPFAVQQKYVIWDEACGKTWAKPVYKHTQAYSYPIAVALIVIAQIHHSRRGILTDFFLIICASEIDEE